MASNLELLQFNLQCVIECGGISNFRCGNWVVGGLHQQTPGPRGNQERDPKPD